MAEPLGHFRPDQTPITNQTNFRPDQRRQEALPGHFRHDRAPELMSNQGHFRPERGPEHSINQLPVRPDENAWQPQQSPPFRPTQPQHGDVNFNRPPASYGSMPPQHQENMDYQEHRPVPEFQAARMQRGHPGHGPRNVPQQHLRHGDIQPHQGIL